MTSELKPKKLTAINASIPLDVRSAVPALCFRDMTSERTPRTKAKILELQPKTWKLKPKNPKLKLSGTL